MGLLPPDWSSLGDASLKQWVETFARDEGAFFTAFSETFTKLSMFGYEGTNKLQRCIPSPCKYFENDNKYQCAVENVKGKYKHNFPIDKYHCLAPSEEYRFRPAYLPVALNKRCSGESTSLGSASTQLACAKLCAAKEGCKYFALGVGSFKGGCRWEMSQCEASQLKKSKHYLYKLTVPRADLSANNWADTVGKCELVGGRGARGLIKCGDQLVACCTTKTGCKTPLRAFQVCPQLACAGVPITSVPAAQHPDAASAKSDNSEAKDNAGTVAAVTLTVMSCLVCCIIAGVYVLYTYSSANTEEEGAGKATGLSSEDAMAGAMINDEIDADAAIQSMECIVMHHTTCKVAKSPEGLHVPTQG